MFLIKKQTMMNNRNNFNLKPTKMKKFMIAALLVASASTTFAQDVVKQITKAKNYAEAENLLKQNIGSLSAEQKAKCYNALVGLAMQKVTKEQATESANQVAVQLKQGNVEPYDTVGLYKAVYDAIANGITCDEFDKQPNDKGKVKPKYDGNADKLYAIRPQLINGGIYYQNKRDEANAYKYLAYYVESADAPLFASKDKKKDANLTQIAYFAGIYAYQAKDYAKAEKFADIAVNDSTHGKEAFNIKLAVMQAQLKNHADSVAYVQKVKALYDKDPQNDMLFGTLINLYSSLKDEASANALVEAKIAADPKNFTAWAVKGQNAMIAQKLEDAIAAFKNALEIEPENAQVNAFLGACLFDRAQKAEDRAAGKTGRVSAAAEAQIKPVFEEARTYLEKAKQLDPNREKSQWAYALYRCYYRLYGAEDPRTKEAEALTK